MKNLSIVSSAVLIANGLLFLGLGARVWSAPDVFASDIGLAFASQSVIEHLSWIHGASFIAIGVIALFAMVTPPLVRWAVLLVLTLAGSAAYVGLWTLSGPYTMTLLAALAINALVLVTAFFGEPLSGAGMPRGPAGEPAERLHWG